MKANTLFFMSGFFGLFGHNPSHISIENHGRIISHRGPDSRASIHTPLFHVSFSRLALQKPLDGKGVSEYKGSVLVLDGEIYFENRNGLTDAEQLHRKLVDDGFSILRGLDGQFAFALYKDNRLFLGKDHLGIKPLYYARLSSGDIVFSSEIKAISQLPQIKKDLNQPVIECFKGMGYNLFMGETCFRDIKSVIPGSLLEFGLKQDAVRRSFFEYDMPETDEDDFDFEAVGYELNSGIKRCLNHDPDNGKALFLSGGLDSGYLLAQGMKYSGIAPFTLWDSENREDIDDARLLCKTLHVRLNEAIAQWPLLDKMIVHYAWHFEMPIGGSGFDLLGGVAFHVLAKTIAKNGYRVALCGEGADEFFLGYHQYHMAPSILRDKLENAIQRDNLIFLRKKLDGLRFFQDTERAARFIAAKYGIAEYHAHSVDRSSTAFGLEARPPFLNHKLATMLKSLNAKFFIDRENNWTKIPLRKYFRQCVPDTEARSAVRRKRAMTYSLWSFGQKISELLKNKKAKISADEAFWRLFFFLHVHHDFPSCPDVSFSELLPELEKCTPLF